jgi:hypothetical protein
MDCDLAKNRKDNIKHYSFICQNMRLAYGMTAGIMMPALRHMDEAGFDCIELIDG